MSKLDKKYSNSEITVYWKPEICIHSRICFSNLIQVFDPRKKPWIDLSKGATDEIIAAVKKCPSGALSYKSISEDIPSENLEVESDKLVITLLADGPLEISGECIIIDKDGNEEKKSGKIFMCRCGASSKKPFCDGTHRKINFTS